MLEIAKQDQSNESKVGKILSDRTQKAVITLVLAMLLSAAVLDIDLYITTPQPFSLGLEALVESFGDPVAFDASLEAYIASHDESNASKYPLLQVVVDDFLWSSGEDLSALRTIEKQISAVVDSETDLTAVAVHDIRISVQMGAILGLVTTLVVCIVLATGSLLLSKITQDLVLTPIEDMISKVKDITSNPIQAAQQAEEDAVKIEEQEKKLLIESGKLASKASKNLMETEVL